MEQTRSGAGTETYAGFGIRVVASIIDSVILFFVIAPPIYLIYGPEYLEQQDQFVAGWADFLLTWVFPMVAVVLFWVFKSATPGKMLLNLKIVDSRTGQPPTTGQAVIRYLGYYVSAIPALFGFLWVLFDDRKQGWHDKMAKTVVVRDSSS